MVREKVGQVTENEKNEIERLYGRKTALQEMLLLLNDENFNDGSYSKLYEKLISDLSQTTIEFENWWEKTSKKYSWKNDPTAKWFVNFETNEIFIAFLDGCSCSK